MHTLGPNDNIEEDQTTFKRSGASNQVALVRPPTPGWRMLLRPPSRASKGILGLPDELLHDIVRQATPRHSRYNYTDRADHYRPYIALAKSCRRLHRLATAMMYSGLYLSIGTDETSANRDKYPVEVMRKLLRSFQENPRLGELCTDFDIMLYHPRRRPGRQWEDYDVPDIPLDEEAEAHVEVVTALAALVPGTQRINVTGSIHRFQEIWIILGIASANAPRLEEVRLCQFGGTAHGPICDSLCRAGALKNLEVSNVRETTGIKKEVARQHPVFVEKMAISNYFQDAPESFRHLVSWPERIEHLELESESEGRGGVVTWGLPDLMPALSCQRDNLRTLAIGRAPKSDTGLSGFSVSDFPNLEELELSRWSTGTLVAEQDNLFAPRLRKFTWCFNIDGMINGMGCDVSDFGEEEETWLRSLMTTAVERGARLSHVHVGFYPYFERVWEENLSGVVFPWNRIDALREEFRGAGIRVTCESNPKWYEGIWARSQPGYRSPTPPPRSPPPEPGAHLPGPETDGESVVSLDGEGQENKITTYFRPLPLRRKTM
ncbi:uncharacterized protein DNG_02276 [Cephalotrichum gorgonifer]|uniref:F-box domain-containing protein n=1 Tax=Cephalotrichum gorgonifer TaxID=2041049 RepID=A0AAE8SSI6_9PEZI|nr:uncharacterized protein DNG_02276 [Cephalotrichum gorgonifer]